MNFTALAFGLLLIGQLLFWSWSSWITQELVDVPLTLDHPVVVTQEIYVPAQQSYELSFIFSRHPQGNEDLRAFLDGEGYLEGKWSAGGAPIPVRWSLTNTKSGHLAASGATNASHASGWSDTLVWRHAAYIKVSPGHYRFQARILRAVPELRNAGPRLRLALPAGKSAGTWQLGFVFWGKIISTLIALPLQVVLLALVLWRQARPATSVGSFPSTGGA